MLDPVGLVPARMASRLAIVTVEDTVRVDAVMLGDEFGGAGARVPHPNAPEGLAVREPVWR